MNQGLEIINCTYNFLKNEKKIINFNCKFLPINCNNCKFRTNHSSSIMAFAVSTDHNSELAYKNNCSSKCKGDKFSRYSGSIFGNCRIIENVVAWNVELSNKLISNFSQLNNLYCKSKNITTLPLSVCLCRSAFVGLPLSVCPNRPLRGCSQSLFFCDVLWCLVMRPWWQRTQRTINYLNQPWKLSSSRQSRQISEKLLNDIPVSKHKREEIARQNDVAMRLARQKQELEFELLHEENRKQLAEAHLVELELTEDLSETNADFQEFLSRLSGAGVADGTRRIKDWVDSSPTAIDVVNLTDVVNSVASTTPITTTSTAEALVPEPMRKPAPAISIEPTSVHSFPNVLQRKSANGATPTPPMIVVQQPQPTMKVTQASTVNAPVITQSLPKFTRTYAMPTNHPLPNTTSWTFPIRPVQLLT